MIYFFLISHYQYLFLLTFSVLLSFFYFCYSFPAPSLRPCLATSFLSSFFSFLLFSFMLLLHLLVVVELCCFCPLLCPFPSPSLPALSLCSVFYFALLTSDPALSLCSVFYFALLTSDPGTVRAL